MTDGNSALEIENNVELEKKLPPPVTAPSQEKVAPIAVPTSRASTNNSSVPLTNRNEQQKSLQRLSFSDSPTSNIVPSSTRQNPLSELRNSGSSSAFTPASLNSNMEKYMAQMAESQSSNGEQTNKESFFSGTNVSNPTQGGNYQWNTDFSLWKGTLITAVLDTAVNTDLPGVVIATVTQNVYSSNNGKYLLIPQGSRVFAQYNSSISYGQNRVQIAWNTLIRPDGLEINLGNLNGVDKYGSSGNTGYVNNHYFEYGKAFGLIALFSVFNTKMQDAIDTTNNLYAQNVMADIYSEQQQLNNKILDKALDIKPTIKIKVGTIVNLITNVTMDIPPSESVQIEQRYVRQ